MDVAAVGSSSLAFSSRSEVSFIQLKGSNEPSRAVFAGGAHWQSSRPGAEFSSHPWVQQGLLIVRPTDDSEHEITVTKGTEGKLYFYRDGGTSRLAWHGNSDLRQQEERGGVE